MCVCCLLLCVIVCAIVLCVSSVLFLVFPSTACLQGSYITFLRPLGVSRDPKSVPLAWSPVVSRGLPWSSFRVLVPPGCNCCLFDLCVFACFGFLCCLLVFVVCVFV